MRCDGITCCPTPDPRKWRELEHRCIGSAGRGRNRGIGRETARQLAGLGHAVLLSARHPEDVERAVVDLAPNVPGRLLPCRLDVTDADDIRALARRVERVIM
ncbi:SDR family NAD(P)-dependent oxidoreductase [Streptomyces agglomeratus]|uniref:SDR family NAD(P)-dependent oxidoreductase n=1 Tax=Streptomyces agglomeratus TaxID=285458 RepID=UPI001F0AC589|nr:SDR family NAD(P)-dependent oxidoreductase [Streptomyces agglomeratus]